MLKRQCYLQTAEALRTQPEPSLKPDEKFSLDPNTLQSPNSNHTTPESFSKSGRCSGSSSHSGCPPHAAQATVHDDSVRA